jgi:hypothetical protein
MRAPRRRHPSPECDVPQGIPEQAAENAGNLYQDRGAFKRL